MPLVEQELPTLPEHVSSSPVFNAVPISRSFLFLVVFCRSLFVPMFYRSLFVPMFCRSLFVPMFYRSLFVPMFCRSLFVPMFWPISVLSFFNLLCLIVIWCLRLFLNTEDSQVDTSFLTVSK